MQPEENPAGPAPILFLSHTAEMSGAEMSLLALISALDRTKFSPIAVLPGTGPFMDRLVAAGVPAHVHRLTPATIRSPFGLLGNLRALRSLSRARGVRILHANSFHAIKLAAPFRRTGGPPLVGHIRDILPFTRLTRAAIFSCDRVVCVSEAAAENLRRGEGPGRIGRLRVIHNGVDADRFRDLPSRDEALARLGVHAAGGPTVGIAAPLVRWKGQDVFLKAAAAVRREIPGAVFLVAGGDAFAEEGYVESLRAAAAAPGLAGHVHLLGFRENLRDLFAAMDVVVCASVKPDPLPRAVLEAMAAGRPVIASDIGGLPEEIADGMNGFLVPAGDPDALASGILNLLRDADLRRRMGREAASVAAARFSLDAHAAQVARLYEEILGG